MTALHIGPSRARPTSGQPKEDVVTTMTLNGHTEPALAEHVTVRPVRHGDREIGAYVIGAEGARFVPAVDPTVIALAALGTAMTVALSIAGAIRRHPAIGTVTMGPGGWVSLKRTSSPPLRDGGRRPWWAHLLRAHRLVVKD
jgi:hypothetical protein